MTPDKCLINAFFQTQVALVALSELVLDVSTRAESCWPPVDAHHLGLRLPRVRCPALVRVLISALPTGHRVTVRPTKVTRLGRALGLGAPAATPVLTLAGCRFHDPLIWPALDRLFSSVQYVECAADVVPGYYHTCRVFDDLKWHERIL